MNSEPQSVANQTINVDYDSGIDAIYLEAWKKTQGMKAVFWKAFVSIVLVMIITTTLAPIVSSIFIPEINHGSHFMTWAVKFLINLLLLAPLLTGLLMLCIKNCTDTPAPINTIFHYIPYWKRLWVFPVAMTIFHFLISFFSGYIIFQIIIVFIAIFWTVLYLFYIPLTVEKSFPVTAALALSRKTILQNLSQIFGFLLIAIIMLFASALTLGVGLIWTVPWFCNATAIFYRELFGIQMSLV